MKALDLFCGGGGACIGLQQAGFDVTGIDINPHPNYPGTFIQADALRLPVDILDFEFVWASPPCQRYSVATVMGGYDPQSYPDMVPDVQALIDGHPYSCIENVPGSPLRKDVVLTGPVVGLDRIHRKRIFELSWFMLSPQPIGLAKGLWERGLGVTVTKSLSSSSHYYTRKAAGLTGHVSNAEAKEVMGIDDRHKMTNAEIGEAVPPPYSEFIAREVINRITNA